MFDNFLNGDNVNIFVALLAGIVTFFASCLLPLVPTYIAYLSGVSIFSASEYKENRFIVFKSAFFFVLGFVASFVFLSLFVSKISHVFPFFRTLVEKLSGIIFTIFGLFMLGIFKHKIFSQERRFNLQSFFSKENKNSNIERLFKKHKNLHAVITGIAFGFGWTPCIGPVLAVILYWATRGSFLHGILLLISYGIGLGIPFLLVALAFENVVPLLKKYSRISQYVSIISGLIILVTGIFLVLGELESISLLIIKFIGLTGITA